MRKPKKPRRNFPLWWHPAGQWCKKVKGKFYYFGIDAKEAEEKYDREKAALQDGKSIDRARGGETTVRQLVNAFLTSKRNRLQTGELTSRTWADYFRVCDSLTDFFGTDRPLAELRPDDFDAYRAKLAKTKGHVAIANAITRARVVFKWGFDNELIDRPVRFGTGFTKPSKKVLRRAKREGGRRVFEAAEIRKLIDAAGQPMKAMILLGINAGLGQSDLAALPIAAINLEKGWLDYPRPKTEVVRRCPLWPETVEAIREALANRPEAKDDADVGLAFLTHRGARWIREGRKADSESVFFNDYVASEFVKLARKLKVKHRGSFYNLRHTFRTEADASKDQPAIDLIMGHTDGSMAEEYRDRIDDARLLAVTDCVRTWLFTTPAPEGKDGPAVLPLRKQVG